MLRPPAVIQWRNFDSKHNDFRQDVSVYDNEFV
jgi:hypothetical protein